MNSSRSPAAPSPRRLSVSEAKAKLSEALRSAEGGAVIIHSHGRDVAAMIGIDEYERLRAGPHGGQRFLDAVTRLKRELGGGVDFDPERARIQAAVPFTPSDARQKS